MDGIRYGTVQEMVQDLLSIVDTSEDMAEH